MTQCNGTAGATGRAPVNGGRWSPAFTGGALLVLALLVVAALQPSLEHGFVDRDDERYVVANPAIRDRSPAGLLRIFTTRANVMYNPLVVLSFAANHAVGGLDPWGYHLVNLVLHVINTWLVFALFSRLGGRPAVGFWVAAIWGVHPHRVESVAWVSERKDVLVAACILTALLAAWRWLGVRRSFLAGNRGAAGAGVPGPMNVGRPEDPAGGGPPPAAGTGWWWLMALAMTAGLLCKPLAALVPVAVPLLAWRRRIPWRRVLAPLLPLALLAAGFGWLAAANERWPTGTGPAGLAASRPAASEGRMVGTPPGSTAGGGPSVESADAVTGVALIALVARNLVWYLQQTLWPSRLAPFHPTPAAAELVGTAVGWTILASLVVWLGLRAARPVSRRLGFGLYLVFIVPLLQLVRFGDGFAVADRYTYLASLGFWLVVVRGGVTWWRGAGRHRFWRLTVPVLLVVALGVAVATTRAECAVWRDGEAMWSRVIERYPNHWFGHFSLGVWLLRNPPAQPRFFEALGAFEVAAQLRPRFAPIQHHLGLALGGLKCFPEALRHLDAALRLAPEEAPVHLHRGLILEALRRPDEALAAYDAAASLAARLPDPSYHRARVLLMRGEEAAAVAGFRRAVDLGFDRVDPRFAAAIASAARRVEASSAAAQVGSDRGAAPLPDDVE